MNGRSTSELHALKSVVDYTREDRIGGAPGHCDDQDYEGCVYSLLELKLNLELRGGREEGGDVRKSEA